MFSFDLLDLLFMYFSSTCISGQTQRAQNQHPFSMKQIPPLSGEDGIETKSIRNKLLLLIFWGRVDLGCVGLAPLNVG